MAFAVSLFETDKDQLMRIAHIVLCLPILFMLTACDAGSDESQHIASIPLLATGVTVASGTIAWEPVGKYDKAEINKVSDYVGQLSKLNLNIEEACVEFKNTLAKTKNTDLIISALNTFTVRINELVKATEAVQPINIKNSQAKKSLDAALMSLRGRAKAIQTLIKNITTDSSEKKTELKSSLLNVIINMRTLDFTMAIADAYMSYGYSIEQIDDSDYTLKDDAEPDRNKWEGIKQE